MAEKRTRRTRAELKEMMIQAGKDVLLDIEPSLGFDDLTYKAVFDHLQTNYDQKVTIGSIHERIWGSLREYQLDVVDALLLEPLIEHPSLAYQRAADVIAAIDTTTIEGRRYAVATCIRMSSYFLYERPSEAAIDVAYAVRVRLFGMSAENPETQAVSASLTEIRRKSNEAYADLVRMLMEVLQIRVRLDAGDPDRVVHEVALLGNAIQIGLQTDPLPLASQPRQLPSGLNGELEEWHADAIALWANVRMMFELNGDGLSDEQRRL